MDILRHVSEVEVIALEKLRAEVAEGCGGAGAIWRLTVWAGAVVARFETGEAQNIAVSD